MATLELCTSVIIFTLITFLIIITDGLSQEKTKCMPGVDHVKLMCCCGQIATKLVSVPVMFAKLIENVCSTDKFCSDPILVLHLF